uniref:Uncharacterized protein n=1 Tax=Steinernema glaseri TaxID=37863 RepID=A0A1I7YW02_9BILA
MAIHIVNNGSREVSNSNRELPTLVPQIPQKTYSTPGSLKYPPIKDDFRDCCAISPGLLPLSGSDAPRGFPAAAKGQEAGGLECRSAALIVRSLPGDLPSVVLAQLDLHNHERAGAVVTSGK